MNIYHPLGNVLKQFLLFAAIACMGVNVHASGNVSGNVTLTGDSTFVSYPIVVQAFTDATLTSPAVTTEPDQAKSSVVVGASLPNGGPYAYTLPSGTAELENGTYSIVAFLDWNRDGHLQATEPQGVPVVVVIADSTEAADFTIDLATDTDTDGLPDWWEVLHGLNPASGVAPDGLLDDFESDGLLNFEEFVLGTSPSLEDTDDDSLTDVEELDGSSPAGFVSSPFSSTSPIFPEAAVFSLGDPASVLPDGAPAVGSPSRFSNLSAWTIEAWVLPDTAQTGELLHNSVTPAVTARDNFLLSLTANVPSVSFETFSGLTTTVTANAAIPELAWTHIAAVLDPVEQRLSLYINGVLSNSVNAPFAMIVARDDSGTGTTNMGGSLNVILDDVRIWSIARSATDISSNFNYHLNTPSAIPGLVANYRFDDNSSSVLLRAEDSVHPLDDAYATSIPAFSSSFPPLPVPVDAFVDGSSVLDDSDDNGLADWWEIFYFGAIGQDPAGDPDADGLSNEFEMVLEYTSPTAADSDGNGTADGDEDANADGLTNLEKFVLGLDPYAEDTDDDGITDIDEVNLGTSPLDDLDPFQLRYLTNDGSDNPGAGGADDGGGLRVPGPVPGYDADGSRFDLGNWTIESMVRLSDDPADYPLTEDAILIRRLAQPGGRITFELGIDHDTLIPYVLFENGSGTEHRVDGYVPLVPGEWTHLAGRFGPSPDQAVSDNELSLFMNGTRIVRDVLNVTNARGAQAGDMVVGQFLIGDLDEVRIWRSALPELWIESNAFKTLLFGRDSAVLGSLQSNLGYLLVDQDASQIINAPFTLQAWMNAPAGVVVERQAGSSPDDGSTLYNYRMAISGGNLVFTVSSLYVVWIDYNDDGIVDLPEIVSRFGTIEIDTGVAVNDGEWHHGALVYNGTTLNTFVDSIAQNSIPVLSLGNINLHINSTTDQNHTIGLISHTSLANGLGNVRIGDGTSTGLVDEVSLRNTAWTQGMIQNNYLQTAQTGADGLMIFNFDYADASSGFVNDVATSGVQGELISNATVLLDTDSNAPIITSNRSLLGSQMALYLSMNDGGVTVQDALTPLNGFTFTDPAAVYTLLNGSTSLEDVVPSSSFPGFASFTGPMSFPMFYPLPVDSPYRLDSDGDDMPDIFEVYYGLDPNTVIPPLHPELGPLGDMDNDGLPNYYEFLANTDPTFWDSDGDAIADEDEDSDGDGLTNRAEFDIGSHPGRTDTDDDGVPDNVELNPLNDFVRVTNPWRSMDPMDPDSTNPLSMPKAMLLTAGSYPEANTEDYQIPRPYESRDRFTTESWTLETWYRPSDAAQTGSIVRYAGVSWEGGTPDELLFYELGVNANVPYVSMETTSPSTISTLSGGDPLDAEIWVHLAATYDADSRMLTLYQDGVLIQQLEITGLALSGSETARRLPGHAFIGDYVTGLSGHLKDLRIWNYARSENQLEHGMDNLIQLGAAGIIANFRFDDGRQGDIANPADDGFGAEDGRGAEDYAYPVSLDSLETPWTYSLREVVFDTVDVTEFTSHSIDQFDDINANMLADWWEDLYYSVQVEYLTTTRDGTGLIIDGIPVEERFVASSMIPSGLQRLNWSIDYQPLEPVSNHRLWEQPDTAYYLKGFYLDNVPEFAELRLSIRGDATIWINGNQLDLSAAGIVPSPETFPTAPNGGGENTYYVPSNLIQPFLVQGQNLIAVQMDNNNGNSGNTGEYEWFDVQLLVDGALVLYPSDSVEASREDLRWWVYGQAGSLAEPPADVSGRTWLEADYGNALTDDLDDDGLNNYQEFLVKSNPADKYSLDRYYTPNPNPSILDSNYDRDGDGLTNSEEMLTWGTDPLLADSDDDGYSDGDEVDATFVDTNYGFTNMVTHPADSRSPYIPRSMIMMGSALEPYDGDRFAFIEEEAVGPAPVVVITDPSDGDDIAVRFAQLTGTVTSTVALDSVSLYINGTFYQELSLDASGTFDETIIIRSGTNELRVEAIDVDGGAGEDVVTVNGTFPPVDIRVTQTWNTPGDLDTWLVDPTGAHMGWTATGPGLPADSGAQIGAGALLDIDDVSGTGPENISIPDGTAIDGDYQVWMNNYSHTGSPLSTVRILVNEGESNEQFVEFGPQSIVASDFNGTDPAAWWQVTTISWPSGTMNPPGTPIVGGSAGDVDPETGFISTDGFTYEMWIRPGDDDQTGSLARYTLRDGRIAYELGLVDNAPYLEIRNAADSITYSVEGGALPAGEWTHVAFVYSEEELSVRLHINGSMVVAQQMAMQRLKDFGELEIDGTRAAETFTSLNIDEVRIWDKARPGGLIRTYMFSQAPNGSSLVASYGFDDGGLGIEDRVHANDRDYDLGGYPQNALQIAAVDSATVIKPGADGIWFTGDDVVAAAVADGFNDLIVSHLYAPFYDQEDEDKDRIPDWWELLYFGDFISANVGNDTDGDGLNELYEYYAGTNPLDQDSDNDGTKDGAEDKDGDGLMNIQEQDVGSHPRLADTDDDGIADGDELIGDVIRSLQPINDRVLSLPGGDAHLRLPLSDRFNQESFTIMTWLNPSSVTGTIWESTVQASVEQFEAYMLPAGNFEFSFSAGDGSGDVTLTTARILPLDIWTHVAVTYDGTTGRTEIFFNGVQAASGVSIKRPASNGVGVAQVRIGEGFTGYMDEWAMFGRALSQEEIEYYSEGLAGKAASGLAAFYSFDDSTAASFDTVNDRWAGTSGNSIWFHGQVEDYTPGFETDWWNDWMNAASLMGDFVDDSLYGMITPVDPSPVMYSQQDTNGDGIPDWWYQLFGWDPSGPSIAYQDLDGDGLWNYTEYLLYLWDNTYNPLVRDSFGDGASDGERDPDFDGLSNQYEQDVAGTLLTSADTDDDGLSDWEETTGKRLTPFWHYQYQNWLDMIIGTPEPVLDHIDTLAGVNAISNPLSSRSPDREGFLRVDGTGYSEVPDQPRHLLRSWTLEALVSPDPTNTTGGAIIRRRVFNPYRGGTGINYEMGLEDDGSGGLQLYALYEDVPLSGSSTVTKINAGAGELVTGDPVNRVPRSDEPPQTGGGNLPQGWTHVAASYDAENHTLRLYINGQEVSARTNAFEPAGLGMDENLTFQGELRVGEGFIGNIDNVAIYGNASSLDAIASSAAGENVYNSLPTNFESPVNGFFGGGAFQPMSPAAATAKDHILNEVVVRFVDGVDAQEANLLAAGFGLQLKSSFSLIPVHVFTIMDGSSVEDKLTQLNQIAQVRYSEPNFLLQKQTLPNDPLLSEMWGLINTGQDGGTPGADINVADAWEGLDYGSSRVKVAVIDTGIDYSHPDLWPNMWPSIGYDFVDDDADPMDTDGHGTHVAGTIGAAGNNGAGVVGVSWRPELIGIRFLGAAGGTNEAAIHSIEFAVEKGAKISNNSWGGAFYSQAVYDAVAAAGRKGHLFICAAGNDNFDVEENISTPSSFNLPNMITVAASDNNDERAVFSNWGSTVVHIAAPGVNVKSTLPGGAYGDLSGTSMASPHVSGVAALILAQNPHLDAASIRNLILSTAEEIEGWDEFVLTGGRLDAGAALGGRGALLAFFSYDDFGTTVEDFSYSRDWETGWAHAATLAADARIVQVGGVVSSLTVDCVTEDLSKALDAYGAAWTTNGWYCDPERAFTGDSSAKAGGLLFKGGDPSVGINYEVLMGHNQTAWLETQVVGPGVLTFQWSWGTEEDLILHSDNADNLDLYVDGNRVERRNGWSNPIYGDQFGGNNEMPIGTDVNQLGWEFVSVNIPEGVTTIRWQYSKDAVLSQYPDAVWLDDVKYTHTGADTDGDNIPDAYESLVFNTDPNLADTDGDMILDGDEIKMGLDPLVAETLAVKTDVPGGLTWSGIAGAKYLVQRSTDLINGPWEEAFSGAAPGEKARQMSTFDGEAMSYTDPDPNPPPTVYYRLILLAP